MIRWAPSYRYLGFMLNSSLSPEFALAHTASSLRGAWASTFMGNKILRDAPPTLGLEVFNTTVLGAANHHFSILTPTPSATNAFNEVRKKAACLFLRTTESAPAITWTTDSRLGELRGIVAREHARLFMELSTSPFRATALAPRIFAVLRGRNGGRPASDPT